MSKVDLRLQCGMPCSKLEVSTAQHRTLSGAGYLHQSRFDYVLPIGLVDPVDLGRYLQSRPGADGDFDSEVGPLFREDSSQKREISALRRSAPGGIEGLGVALSASHAESRAEQKSVLVVSIGMISLRRV